MSEENDPFEREACSEACFDDFEDYKKRGYNLLGFEDKDYEGLKLKQFVNLNIKSSWVDIKEITPWQNTYADEVHTEDLYDFSKPKKENFNNRSQATTKTPPKQSDKKSYPLKNEGGRVRRARRTHQEAVCPDFEGHDVVMEGAFALTDLYRRLASGQPFRERLVEAIAA